MEKKHLTYGIVAVAVIILGILGFKLFTGGDEAPPDTDITGTQEVVEPTPAPMADASIEDEDEFKAPAMDMIRFDTDSAYLRAGDRRILDKNITWLRKNPDAQIMIEGHCDERHSDEYNMALGWKRARNVEKYLKARGISSRSLKTISYGDTRPLVLGHSEECWWQNRRVQFSSWN